jgi:hypothetical protein
MTRKDYELIAQAFSNTINHCKWEEEDVDDFKSSFVLNDVILGLEVKFLADNPRFDRKRFREACGIDD